MKRVFTGVLIAIVIVLIGISVFLFLQNQGIVKDESLKVSTQNSNISQ